MTPSPTLPAATVLVLRAAAAAPPDELEVLLVRRSHRASFMANAYVFPGGRVDAADAGTAEVLDPLFAMRRAAARELGEEVGLQVGDPAQLVPFAHWITPAAEPKRFDTAFFLWPLWRTASGPADAALPEVQVDGSEVFDPLWTTPTAALARYAAGTLNLPPPTVCTLEDLAAEIDAARAAATEPGAAPGALLQTLLTRCADRRPLPVLPKLCAESDGAMSIVMPWDPQYPELPGEGTAVPALAAAAARVPQRIRRCQLRPPGSGPRADRVANLGTATASAPGSGGAAAVPAAHMVVWTVERADN